MSQCSYVPESYHKTSLKYGDGTLYSISFPSSLAGSKELYECDTIVVLKSCSSVMLTEIF